MIDLSILINVKHYLYRSKQGWKHPYVVKHRNHGLDKQMCSFHNKEKKEREYVKTQKKIKKPLENKFYVLGGQKL